MISKSSCHAVLFLICITAAHSETRSLSYSASGTINMPLEVDAIVKTQVLLYSGAEGSGLEQPIHPYPYTGEWIFTWDSDTPDTVELAGSLVLGDHFSLTDAGELGGITRQTFYNLVHHFSGRAGWNSRERSLILDIPIDTRDDGRASRVTQDREAECIKIRGIGAGRACRAFYESSPALEGLSLRLYFREDLSVVEGRIVMIQYGGSGITKSYSELNSDNLKMNIKSQD